MKLTFVHPAVGHRAGESYVRTWQMESLPIAVLAGLTPPDIDTAFYDDRMETIDYDAPTDAVAIPDRDLHRRARLPDRQRISQPRSAGCDGRFSCDAGSR